MRKSLKIKGVVVHTLCVRYLSYFVWLCILHVYDMGVILYGCAYFMCMIWELFCMVVHTPCVRYLRYFVCVCSEANLKEWSGRRGKAENQHLQVKARPLVCKRNTRL